MRPVLLTSLVAVVLLSTIGTSPVAAKHGAEPFHGPPSKATPTSAPSSTSTPANASTATPNPTSAPKTANSTPSPTSAPNIAGLTPTPTSSPNPTVTASASAFAVWGVYSGAVDSGQATIGTAISQYQSELNHPVQAYHMFVAWQGTDWPAIASWGGQYALDHGMIPFITYEAWNRPLDQIAAGAFDSDIDSVAVGAGATGKEIWIRLFHEFNDCQAGGYPWDSCYWPSTTWIAAYQHVVSRFRADGASNVKFIWEPDGTSSCTAANIAPYYPGDGYVDYTGWDDYGYNTAADYQQVSAVAQKPMVLGEVAGNDSQVSWLQSMATNLNDGAYSRVHGVVWFDGGSVTIAGNPQIEATLKSMLAGPAFS